MPLPVRERLLEAAESLIVQGGVNATSTDAVLERADAGRRSLYTHFGSKEELIVQALRQRDDRLMAWFQSEVDAAGAEPRARILALFAALDGWFRQPDFNGCAFVMTIAESQRTGRASAASLRFKGRFAEFVKALVVQGSFANPARLTRQLLILVEGATVSVLVDPDAPAAKDALEMARSLLDARHAENGEGGGSERPIGKVGR